jgi:hypothetical protein
VQVQVTAAGLPATGTVLLVLKGTTHRISAPLRNGVVTLNLSGVPAGRGTFLVTYSGSAAAPATSQSIVLGVTG